MLLTGICGTKASVAAMWVMMTSDDLLKHKILEFDKFNLVIDKK
jgi:hypothetical protein